MNRSQQIANCMQLLRLMGIVMQPNGDVIGTANIYDFNEALIKLRTVVNGIKPA